MIQTNGCLINKSTGVKFYNDKNNNFDGFGVIQLRISLSKGEAFSRLETGLVGMKKGEIRCIAVPYGDLSYKKYPNMELRPMNDVNQRVLESIIKNQQEILPLRLTQK